MSHLHAPYHEPRPRDFHARFKRSNNRSRLAGRRVRGKGRNLLVLLGAIALPAVAAPGDWQRFEIGNAGEAQVWLEPMPFEKPGSSFPGSAFYYLEFEEPLPAPGEDIRSDAAVPARDRDGTAGPSAKALRVDNSGVDRSRALQCLTAAIYYEAASEPDSGQRAVAQVVLNRVAHPAYPNTVCGVVYQGSERRTGCQFSFTCDGSLARRPSRMFWNRAESVALAALGGYVHAPAGLATHYHTVQVNPYWAPSLDYLGTIGAHRFYRFGGAAGRPTAFRFAYLGGEPAPQPRRTPDPAGNQAAAALDPVTVQRAFEGSLQLAGTAAVEKADAAPARPAYTQEVEARGGDTLYRGDRLPGSDRIKPEYRNSGRWIAQPGT